ncbi:MAG: response regulator transcription factor [Erysipelotrichaceae bacterium]|nr:response regulator transcription factor [Erysipelotrichaceae bacterium]MBR0474516.1 response regulator transcription factor [Erysipelotrichaceae bacterium]
MARLLIVDDEEKIREMIKKYAVFEGHEVAEASDGFTAVKMAEENDYDLIVMDVMMPELDGFSAVKAIRKVKQTPVIMLSARGEEYDRIHGFEVGVDDYVIKPFSVKELMMRIQAILSRRKEVATSESNNEIVSYEGLTIDYTARIVTVDGQRVEMSPKEYELLFFLSRNKNIALSRERLLTEVWGYDYYGDDRTLDTHIKLLRRSLGQYQKYIVTVRGVGYRFEA